MPWPSPTGTDDGGTGDDGTVEHVGGSPANVAVGLAALDHSVSLATWIATDDHGNRIAEHCHERGVALTPGSQGAPFTSVAHATIDGTGGATYRFDLEWQLAAVPELRTTATCTPAASRRCSSPAAARFGHAADGAPDGHDLLRPQRPARAHGHPVEARRIIEECVALADVVKVTTRTSAWLRPGRSRGRRLADWARTRPDPDRRDSWRPRGRAQADPDR